MLVKYYLSDNIKIPFENFTILSKKKKKKKIDSPKASETFGLALCQIIKQKDQL